MNSHIAHIWLMNTGTEATWPCSISTLAISETVEATLSCAVSPHRSSQIVNSIMEKPETALLD